MFVFSTSASPIGRDKEGKATAEEERDAPCVPPFSARSIPDEQERESSTTAWRDANLTGEEASEGASLTRVEGVSANETVEEPRPGPAGGGAKTPEFTFTSRGTREGETSSLSLLSPAFASPNASHDSEEAEGLGNRQDPGSSTSNSQMSSEKSNSDSPCVHEWLYFDGKGGGEDRRACDGLPKVWALSTPPREVGDMDKERDRDQAVSDVISALRWDIPEPPFPLSFPPSLPAANGEAGLRLGASSGSNVGRLVFSSSSSPSDECRRGVQAVLGDDREQPSSTSSGTSMHSNPHNIFPPPVSSPPAAAAVEVVAGSTSHQHVDEQDEEDPVWEGPSAEEDELGDHFFGFDDEEGDEEETGWVFPFHQNASSTFSSSSRDPMVETAQIDLPTTPQNEDTKPAPSNSTVPPPPGKKSTLDPSAPPFKFSGDPSLRAGRLVSTHPPLPPSHLTSVPGLSSSSSSSTAPAEICDASRLNFHSPYLDTHTSSQGAALQADSASFFHAGGAGASQTAQQQHGNRGAPTPFEELSNHCGPSAVRLISPSWTLPPKGAETRATERGATLAKIPERKPDRISPHTPGLNTISGLPVRYPPRGLPEAEPPRERDRDFRPSSGGWEGGPLHLPAGAGGSGSAVSLSGTAPRAAAHASPPISNAPPASVTPATTAVTPSHMLTGRRLQGGNTSLPWSPSPPNASPTDPPVSTVIQSGSATPQTQTWVPTGGSSTAPRPDTELMDLHSQISSRAFNSRVAQNFTLVQDWVIGRLPLNVREVIRGGNVGKGTAISAKGAASAELVLLVDGLPPFSSSPSSSFSNGAAGGWRSFLPPMMKSAAAMLMLPCSLSPQISSVRAEPDHLFLEGRGGFSVRILVAPYFPNFQEAKQAAARVPPAARSFLEPCFAKEETAFLARQQGCVKVTVRLLKWWKALQNFSSPHTTPSDYLLELVGVFTHHHFKPKDQRASLSSAFVVLSQLGSARVTWHVNYPEEDIWPPLLDQRPLIVDPARPFVNVADPLRFDPREVMEFARVTDLNSLSQSFPTPMPPTTATPGGGGGGADVAMSQTSESESDDDDDTDE
uniref:2'-5'-oligoadenylate synthetase 1 domain-containing protein n=1 Tax=Chromera velia CCMP2878 TaxID=1169474 RepID=A0A0G4I095_9ALVE|eukprot:Cvel_9878.t1-p1 / transcript=Cvel_9878.t1 / gene=Cvel_9878 / organism=Chromera_velia_CCMP2878 / gene_product=hypothetical protein / transcript_product=hypothetical protein / location=Cvel_scaffold582:63924-68453(-) / protein_length=1069 / sequence_SO=supercontig / SO=protein_coding / is_pseudo=false